MIFGIYLGEVDDMLVVEYTRCLKKIKEVLNVLKNRKVHNAIITVSKWKRRAFGILGICYHIYNGVNKEGRAKQGLSIKLSRCAESTYRLSSGRNGIEE